MTTAAHLLLKQQSSSIRITGSGEVGEREKICKQIRSFGRVQHRPDLALLLRPPHLRAVVPQSRGECHRRGSAWRVRCVTLYARFLAKKLRPSRGASRNDGNLCRGRQRKRKRS